MRQKFLRIFVCLPLQTKKKTMSNTILERVRENLEEVSFVILSLTYVTINEDVDEEETVVEVGLDRTTSPSSKRSSHTLSTNLLTHKTQKTDRCVGSSHRLVVETEYENETRAERSGMETS